MTTSPETVLDSKPRIKQDVLFTQTPNGVLFHNSESGFQLTSPLAYRLSQVLVPYFNGSHSLKQISDALDERQRHVVIELATALLDRGFARDCAGDAAWDDSTITASLTEVFGAQLNYIDHYVGEAPQRFMRFHDARIAVVGGDDIAGWCVLGLVRNGSGHVAYRPVSASPDRLLSQAEQESAQRAVDGCPVELTTLAPSTELVTWSDLAGFDVVVVSTGSVDGERQLYELVSTGVPAGARLLPVSTIGARAVVGPLMVAGSRGCWMCLTLRLAANDDSGATADVWSRILRPGRRSPTRPGRTLAAMLGNLASYEVFRTLTGCLPAETEHHVVLQDIQSLDTVIEPLLPHPACSLCPPASEPDDDLSAVNPSLASATSPEAADDAAELLVELNRAGELIRPGLGVFAAFDDEHFTQLPVKVGRLRFGLGSTGRRSVFAFDVHHTVGARLRALDRAAELYAEHGERTDPGLTDRSGAEPPVVAGDELTVRSGHGLAADVTAWVRGRSLLFGERRLVPAGAVRTFGPDNRDGGFVRTRAGSGAGRTPGQALGVSLLSALAYDALTDALRGRHEATAIPLECLDQDVELTFLTRSARTLGVEVELLDLSGELWGGQVVARTTDPRTGEPAWAHGSHIRWQQAALAALRDLVGALQVGRETAADELIDVGDPLLRGLDPYALPVAPTPAPTAPLDRSYDWDLLRDGLRRSGRDAIAVRTTPDDLARSGFTTTRVLLTRRG